MIAFRIGKRWRHLRTPKADTLFLAGVVSLVMAAVVLMGIVAYVLIKAGPEGYVTVREDDHGNYRLLIYNENYARWVDVSSTAYDSCPQGTYYPTCARS